MLQVHEISHTTTTATTITITITILTHLESSNICRNLLLQARQYICPVLIRVRATAALLVLLLLLRHEPSQRLQVALHGHQLLLKRLGYLVELHSGVVAELLPLDPAIKNITNNHKKSQGALRHRVAE
jgi:hypothetical protein